MLRWILLMAITAGVASASSVKSSRADEYVGADQVNSEADQVTCDSCGTLGCDGCGCTSCCSCGNVGCCGDCCYATSGICAVAEATFFRYHRADGSRYGQSVTQLQDERTEFGFDAAPRVTVGYQRWDTFDFRVRWWNHDAEKLGVEPGVQDGKLAVTTWTIDVEAFETIWLTECLSLELSGGIRFNDFEETMSDISENDLRINSFKGYGGVIGTEAKYMIRSNIGMYGRARCAVMMSDKDVVNIDPGTPDTNVTQRDTVHGMFEIAFGVEASRCLSSGAIIFARAGVEWQNWYNYSTSFIRLRNENFFGGPSDVGFGGYTANIGITR